MLPIGYYVRRKRVFKPMLLKAVPLYCFGLAVGISAITVGHSFGLFLCSQALIAAARSTFEAVKELALLEDMWRRERPNAQRMPTLFAYITLSEKIGGMAGATLSDILWSKALPNPPNRYLNSQTILNAERVHPALSKHLAYSEGSIERRAILYTYDTTQVISLLVGIVVMVAASLCLQRIRESDEISIQRKRQSINDTREIVTLLKQESGRKIRDALKTSIHSQDLVDAYLFDKSEFERLMSLDPKVRRMAVDLVTKEAPAWESIGGAFFDSDVEALEDFELRQDMYLALKDESHCRRMLEALEDEKRREQQVDALLTYKAAGARKLCDRVMDHYELWATRRVRTL